MEISGKAYFVSDPRRIEDLTVLHLVEKERPFEVVKIVKLAKIDYENFITDMVADRQFIEELYYGNIDPQNSGFEDNESVQRELRTISENEDWLAERLNGEEKKRFLDFADAWSAGGGDATLDGFITGFLLGRVL